MFIYFYINRATHQFIITLDNMDLETSVMNVIVSICIGM